MKPVIGIAWYQPWEWGKIRQMVADPDVFEKSHAKWLRGVKKLCRELEADGVYVHRVIIHADELFAWCQEKNIPIDSEARSQFAADKTRLRYAGKSSGSPDKTPGAGAAGRFLSATRRWFTRSS